MASCRVVLRVIMQLEICSSGPRFQLSFTSFGGEGVLHLGFSQPYFSIVNSLPLVRAVVGGRHVHHPFALDLIYLSNA